MIGSEFNKWLFGPEKLLGLLSNGPQIKLVGPLLNQINHPLRQTNQIIIDMCIEALTSNSAITACLLEIFSFVWMIRLRF